MTLTPRSSRMPEAYLDALPRALGLVAETYPRQAAHTSSTMTDGAAYATSIWLRAGDVVSTVYVIVITLGVTVTLSKCGLYNQAGVRLAISADQGVAWESTGIKAVAMLVPYTVPATDLYYAAVIAKATVTLPAIARSASASSIAAAIGSFPRLASTMTGQTDLPDPYTFGNNSVMAWLGVS